ncbi:MAG: phosphohydrolase [Pseudomonadota bacterium]
MSDTLDAPRAKFNAMTEGTQEDWQIIASQYLPFAATGGKRVLEHLKLLAGDYGGFKVDRLTHCLQTATRAHRDGRDDEYTVCALLHDIGDTLGAYNHPDIAAAILKPFVSEANHWMVAHHGIFQGYYYFHYLGMDRDQRDELKDHPHFDYTAEFCAKYDQKSFDPDYDTMPLEAFEPMVMTLFQAPKQGMLAGPAANAS